MRLPVGDGNHASDEVRDERRGNAMLS